jgi:mono/diheme cytochrome c family protein
MAWRQVLVLIGTLIVSEQTLAQEMGSAGRGRALARQECAQCHAVEKQQPQSPDEDAPSFQQIASTPGMNAIALSAALNTSHRSMPNLVLTPDDQSDIVAYVLSLK